MWGLYYYYCFFVHQVILILSWVCWLLCFETLGVVSSYENPFPPITHLAHYTLTFLFYHTVMGWLSPFCGFCFQYHFCCQTFVVIVGSVPCVCMPVASVWPEKCSTYIRSYSLWSCLGSQIHTYGSGVSMKFKEVLNWGHFPKLFPLRKLFWFPRAVSFFFFFFWSTRKKASAF